DVPGVRRRWPNVESPAAAYLRVWRTIRSNELGESVLLAGKRNVRELRCHPPAKWQNRLSGDYPCALPGGSGRSRYPRECSQIRGARSGIRRRGHLFFGQMEQKKE